MHCLQRVKEFSCFLRFLIFVDLAYVMICRETKEKGEKSFCVCYYVHTLFAYQTLDRIWISNCALLSGSSHVAF